MDDTDNILVYKPMYPGFQEKTKHPDNLCIPCCFGRPRGLSQKAIDEGWTVEEKEAVRIKQDGKCAHCGKPPPRWDYHHVDGNRSNNSMNNCEGLCPNCHSVETHEG